MNTSSCTTLYSDNGLFGHLKRPRTTLDEFGPELQEWAQSLGRSIFAVRFSSFADDVDVFFWDAWWMFAVDVFDQVDVDFWRLMMMLLWWFKFWCSRFSRPQRRDEFFKTRKQKMDFEFWISYLIDASRARAPTLSTSSTFLTTPTWWTMIYQLFNYLLNYSTINLIISNHIALN